jgi:predicted transcriptional regulator of viral defense system
LNYLAFREALLPFGVFSTRDALKLFPDFDKRRLFEWQRKGYITRLVNKWYLFAELPLNELLSYRISNCIYYPSYVSLESAFSYYGFIPEGVYSLQAISTRKTNSFQTPQGVFNYRNLQPSFFFGYRVLHYGELPILMATPEKAILDYLYLRSDLHTRKDIEAIRFNDEFLVNEIDWNLLQKYALVFGSITLNNRIAQLKKLLPHAHIV